MLRRDVKTARHTDRSPQNANKILAALPKTSRDWLHTLEPVTLQAGMVLYEPDEAIEHVYFLNDALVSILSMNSDGATLEIGLIGNEGMVGVPAILGGVRLTGRSFRWAAMLFESPAKACMKNSGAIHFCAIFC